MGTYISQTRVMSLLKGKVAFTEEDCDERRMQLELLTQLIDEAEAQVEIDLSIRYAAPFQGEDGTPFKQLPRATRVVIVMLCEFAAIVRVMNTDFGRGSATGGEAYAKTSQEKYDAWIKKLTERFTDADKRLGAFVFPPLASLSRAAHNRAADDGFAGVVLSTNTGNSGAFPGHQITNPSEDFFTSGDPDDC